MKTRLFYWIAYVLFLVAMVSACATTKAVGTIAKQCEPTAAQGLAILDAATKPTQAEALAAIDALGFVLCMLQTGVDEEIAALTPKAGTSQQAITAEDYSPALDNLKAWRAAHP